MKLATAVLAVIVAAPGCGDSSREEVASTSGAVTFGAETTGHPEVVALMQKAVPRCTGTLIAPRVVLTAAHCLDLHYEAVALGADPTRPDWTTNIIAVRRHPAFNRSTLANDYALLLLGVAAPVAPARLADTSPEPGTSVRVVGFGETELAGAPFRKREGTSRAEVLDTDTFTLAADPSQPCHGDSGGPVFLETKGGLALAGVVSEGDAACTKFATIGRVDRQLEGFIRPFLAATREGGAAIGDRCWYSTNCAEGASCYAPPDAPAITYCSAPCSSASECPSGLMCVASTCRFPVSPGALGTDCALDTDCDSGHCWRASKDAPRVCSRTCQPQRSDACPVDFECKLDPDRFNNWGCFQAARPSPASAPAPAAGCSVSERSSGGATGLLGLLLALTMFRRRR